MPKISFVMPCRNRDKMISNTIKSVISQTEKEWELIVVDDHSDKNDCTKTVVKNFSDDRIKYFKLADENGIGIPAARNFGNMMATAKLIAVCDSDDIYYPDRVSLSLSAFAEEGADVVYGDLDLWIEETGEIKKRQEKFAVKPFNLEDFKKFDYIPHPTVVYRRDLVLTFPYNSFFRQAEDYDLLSRLAVAGYKFVYLNKSVVKYRVHAGSISADKAYLYKYKELVQKNRGWI